MLDNQLAQIIIPIIQTGLTNAGLTTVRVKQAYQPVQEGVSDNCVYLFKMPDHLYASPRRTDSWDIDTSQIIHTETQIYETSYQVNAIVIQNPVNVDSITTTDILRVVSATLQSDLALFIFEASNIGIYKISDIRNSYFLDDLGRHESAPSFDFTITHEGVTSNVTPPLETVSNGIYPI